MDRLPKDAVLARVAACCGARELGRLCCVGSAPLQSVALSSWRPLVPRVFRGEQAAVGRGRATYERLFRARRLLLADHGPERDDAEPPAPPFSKIPTGWDELELSSVKFLLMFEGFNKIDGALSFETSNAPTRGQYPEILLSADEAKTTYGPTKYGVFESLFALTRDRDAPEFQDSAEKPGFDGWLCDKCMRFERVTLAAMREDGACARLATWAKDEQPEQPEGRLLEELGGGRVLDFGFCWLHMLRVGFGGAIHFKDPMMDEDDIEAADIVIDLKMKIHDTPEDAARFAANGSVADIDGNVGSRVSFSFTLHYGDGEEIREMSRGVASELIHYMLDRASR